MADKWSRLPYLGLGISAEFDSARSGIDAVALREELPELVDFLEFGGDLDRGLDDHVRRWAARGWPTTYHFLDVNLDEAVDVDEAWLGETRGLAHEIGAAWLCGDAGQWHFGPRDRGQQLLLPPILTAACADEMAENVRRVEEGTGMACLPENPPATAYLGDLHLLDFYARVAERAECGLLVDVAHLAIYQRMSGHSPTTALGGFPLDRVVEIHVAGGVLRDHEGFTWVDDNHTPEPLDETWEILDAMLPGTRNLRALVYECERNSAAEVIEVFGKLRNRLVPGSATREEESA